MKLFLLFLSLFQSLRWFGRRASSVPPVGLSGERWSGRVVRVVDGDTVWAEFGKAPIRIRLAHIDAPETGQPFGEDAAVGLKDLFTRSPEITFFPKEFDTYGRIVGDVYQGDSWINYWLVRCGLAWALPKDSNPEFTKAQIAAQQERAGLWTQAYPTSPWEFRARKQLVVGVN